MHQSRDQLLSGAYDIFDQQRQRLLDRTMPLNQQHQQLIDRAMPTVNPPNYDILDRQNQQLLNRTIPIDQQHQQLLDTVRAPNVGGLLSQQPYNTGVAPGQNAFIPPQPHNMPLSGQPQSPMQPTGNQFIPPQPQSHMLSSQPTGNQPVGLNPAMPNYMQTPSYYDYLQPQINQGYQLPW